MKKDNSTGHYVFSRMEFWLLILLLIFVATFVGYVSFVNAGNGSALTYVSFAGTLISILLALVAIGYTYGESVAERSKVDKVSSEISKLSYVNDSIENHAESLTLLSQELNNHFHIVKENANKTNEMHAFLTSKNQSYLSVSNRVENTKFSTDNINFITCSSDISRVVYLFVLYTLKSHFENHDEKADYFQYMLSLVKMILGDHSYSNRYEIAVGECMFALNIFGDFGLISESDKFKILDVPLFDRIYEIILSSDFDASKTVLLNYDKLMLLIKQGL
ncbi:hypothetical protein [Thalassolituus oleivorans]|uniref:hypothetical protein n=1 Tax=Thalassolituus oleivorans TaxID=187493 RepID=UPI0023F282D9|nr:hypothetical protein [Thalassolituus oleivorans]